MLRTRLWMGALLMGLATLLLLEGRWSAPWFPLLFVVYLLASLLATRELLALLPNVLRPDPALVIGSVAACVVANWLSAFPDQQLPVWPVIGGVWLLSIIGAFLLEMRRFTTPNHITERIALTGFTVAYLGVLPSFLAQLRWLEHSTIAIALAVFVPKGNDIGAYFTGKFLTGRVLGRHHMTPLLSPKKTWQGFTGGMLASVLIAGWINEFANHVLGPWYMAVAFGVAVGTAGVLGDLAESLLKRDLQTKDASQRVPGFGGVLDVVDSLLFAAPVAYVWLRLTTST